MIEMKMICNLTRQQKQAPQGAEPEAATVGFYLLTSQDLEALNQ